MVVADEEVEHGIARVSGDAFDKLIDEGGYRCVTDGYCVERLQVVHEK
jgi:hypothetical protein